MHTRIRRAALAIVFSLAILVSAVPPATADSIVPVGLVVCCPGPGPYTWSYSVALSTGAMDATVGSFVMYDVGGLISGSEVAPPGWIWIEEAFSPIADGIPLTGGALLPPDTPVTNIRWKWTGGLVGPVPFLPLGVFSFLSSRDFGAPGRWASTDYSALTGGPQDTYVPYLRPHPIPEPASLLLLGSGLAMIGSRLRRKQQ